MSLDAVQAALAKDIAQTAWATDYELRGEKVARFRRYVDGDHDAQMTPEMRKLLRISADDNSAPFTSNQCDDVIQTMADRLTVDQMEADNEQGTKWGEDVLDFNRFDGLQMDVHEATLRDGDSFALVEFDEDAQMPHICPELAWDGSSGMMGIYESDQSNHLTAAVKVWNETRTDYADTIRANVYYEDRIEKYIGDAGGKLSPYIDEEYGTTWPIPWLLPNGEPIGVPVIPFCNRQRGQGGFGLSELENATPLQDALNRTLHSMVMAGELTAFRILIAKGFVPPAGLSPGMIVQILGENNGPISKDLTADFSALEGSNLEQFIKMAEFFIQRIEAVTRTPNMTGNTNLSGEAMKQSEIKLLGKVRRFQVKTGNAWEDVMGLAQRVQLAFGKEDPPKVNRWRTRWQDAEIRNDKDTVANVMLVKDQIGKRETLRQLAPVFGWDEVAIDRIMKEAQVEATQRANMMLNSYNPFGGGNNQPGNTGTAPNPN